VGIEDDTCLDLPDGGLEDTDPTAGVRMVAEVIQRVQSATILDTRTSNLLTINRI